VHSLTAQESVAVADAPTPALVRVAGLAKAFGPTQALTNTSFELRAGEVHALIGENGSGKSTLVKILSGVHAPDAGTIELNGSPAPPLRTPRVAHRAGIATAFQEVLVAEARSVLDNVWLGAEGLVLGSISAREKRARASEVLEELLGRRVNLGAAVERLSLSDRQAIGVARALVRKPRILILDEATSALDVATRDRLFAIVNRLRADGVGTVFITHRMDEILQIGDRITVMRSGETVATLERGQSSSSDLVRLMTGSDQLTGHAREERGEGALGELVLRADALVLRPGCAPIDVQIRAGELVGVAGLEGHGQDAFLEALRGNVGAISGRIVRHDRGKEYVIKSTSGAAARGIGYVPRERQHALFAWMSICENFGMPTLGRDTLTGWLRPRRTRARFKQYVDELGIVLGDPDDRITTLSGGNQQKVVIARWLAAGPKILVLNDPTRGIDVGAKRDLYRLLTRLVDEGMAVVMLSSELDEHVELMDRVLVFREHEVFAELERVSLSRSALVSSFFGKETVVGPA
jgi:ABC-type sugar transport system ATPase subunit